jgi:hypothetical protein
MIFAEDLKDFIDKNVSISYNMLVSWVQCFNKVWR